MVVAPGLAVYPGIPTGPALATGAGTSMYMNGTNDYFLNLRESGVTDLNGRNSLTVEFFYKSDHSVTSGSYNLISSSGSVTGQDGNTALAIVHGETNQINGWLNVGGAMVNVNSGNNSILQGNVYHIALTDDGAQVRLFINGVLKETKPASGTVVHKAGEDLSLGPKLSGFMESTFDIQMTKGWVDSIRLSSNARYTADFTSPTAKLSNDGSTLFLLNFDNNYDQFTVANSMYGPSHLFFRRFGGGFGRIGELSCQRYIVDRIRAGNSFT
jgi:Concanavalin A-like lectin/glucanases superfamily